MSTDQTTRPSDPPQGQAAGKTTELPVADADDSALKLAAHLEQLSALHQQGVLSDREYAAAVREATNSNGGGSAPPPAGSSGDGGGRRGLSRGVIALLVGAAVVVVAAAGSAYVLTRDNSEPSPASSGASPATSALAAYRLDSRAARQRLLASARVMSRRLEQTASAASLGLLVRSANQQLAAVNQGRAELADLNPQGAGARTANGLLVRASDSHRQLLLALSRIDRNDPGQALKRFPAMVRDGRDAVAGYRQAAVAAGLAPASVLAAQGLGQLSGVQQALKAQETKLAEQAAAEQQDSSGGGGGGGGTSGGGGSLSISAVSAADLGSTIRVTADYCDRTPGRVNSFAYTATVFIGDVTLGSNTVYADQTRACNTVAVDIPDGMPVGSYDVGFTVDNLTNNVSTSATSGVTVVD